MSLNNYLKETQYDEAGRVVCRAIGNDVIQNNKFFDWEIAGGSLETFTPVHYSIYRSTYRLAMTWWGIYRACLTATINS